MAASADLEMLKDIPGYKMILKAVLKGQIQHLIQQLADETDEESVILTASAVDGTLSHLGSYSATGFFEDHEDIKSQFLGFCLKNRHKQLSQKDNFGDSTSFQTPLIQTELTQESLKHGVKLPGSSSRQRHAPYTVKRTICNTSLNLENCDTRLDNCTDIKRSVTDIPKVDDNVTVKVEPTTDIDTSRIEAECNLKTVEKSVIEGENVRNQSKIQKEATFQNEAEKASLDSDNASLSVSESCSEVIPEGLFVNAGFADFICAGSPNDASKLDTNIDTYVTVKVESISESEAVSESDMDTEEDDAEGSTATQQTQTTTYWKVMPDGQCKPYGQPQIRKEQPMKKRFGTHGWVDTSKKLADVIKKRGDSSERSKRTAAMVFRQFLIEKNEDVDFEYIDKRKLAELLSDFYINARTKDGTMYKFKSLTHMRYSLNRYFRSPPYSREFDILHDEEFAHANKVFKVALQEILASGKGGVNHHQIITNNDLVTLYSSTWLSPNTPSGLQNLVQMNIRLTFCCEVNENMAKMTKSTFKFATDASGSEYVYMQTKSGTINMSKATVKASAQMKEDKDHPDVCPVRTFKMYLSKLNPQSDRLWQYPNEDYVGQRFWYQNKHMGKNTLAKFMSSLSKTAGLSKQYTNQSIRITGNSILSGRSYSLQEIMTHAAVKIKKE